MSNHSITSSSTTTNLNEVSVSYRITSQVGIELVCSRTVPAANQDDVDKNETDDDHHQINGNDEHDSNGKMSMKHVRPLEFVAEGLKSISLTNFTGRLVFHRVAVSSDDDPSVSIFSEEEGSSSNNFRFSAGSASCGGSSRSLLLSPVDEPLSFLPPRPPLPPPRPPAQAPQPAPTPAPPTPQTVETLTPGAVEYFDKDYHHDELGDGLTFFSNNNNNDNEDLRNSYATASRASPHPEQATAAAAAAAAAIQASYHQQQEQEQQRQFQASEQQATAAVVLNSPRHPSPTPQSQSQQQPQSLLNSSSNNNHLIWRNVLRATAPVVPPRNIPDAIRSKRKKERSAILLRQSAAVAAEAAVEASWPKKLMAAGTTTAPAFTTEQHRNEATAQAASSSSTSSTSSSTTQIVSTSPLHILCAQSHGVTVDQLLNCLRQYPNAVRTKDELGRFPLHILGDNESLITSEGGGQETATLFAGHLMNEYPNAILVADKEGFIPFARLIADWIEWSQEQEAVKNNNKATSRLTQHPFYDDVSPSSADCEDEKTTAAPGTLNDGLDFYASRQGGLFGSYSRSDNDNDAETGNTSSSMHWYLTSFLKTYIPRVEVWEEVEWCFVMLSTAMDILGRDCNLPMFQRLHMNKAENTATSNHTNNNSTNSDDTIPPVPCTASVRHLATNDRKELVEALITKMPLLLKYILLIDEDGRDTRERLLGMTITRRLLLCPQAVGKWLIEMINYGGIPARRAIDYFCLISKATVEDYTGGYGTIYHTGDLDSFNEDRQNVFEAVGKLKGTIASLVTLENRETDRAASTAVIWHIMSQKLSRPFVLGLVLIDLLLHLTLMISFRSIAKVNSSLAHFGIQPEGVIYFISTHYLLRKGCEAWVLLAVSPSAVKAYFTNLWTIFDSVAILLTLWATLWAHNLPAGEFNTGLNALVVGLLWIKVLGFLKVVNKEMSTFIIALTQILYDIRLVMIVLIVCVIMFGDMFYIAVSTKNNGQFCAANDEAGESDAVDDFCTSSWDSYLRTYSILLGEFELNDMMATTGTTILFIIFTVFGVVVLLNVLIAVIFDSYGKATMIGHLLFGRARVLYVAQNEALERFLQPSRWSEDSVLRAAAGETSSVAVQPSKHKTARAAIRWTVLLAILGTALYALLFLIGVVTKFGKEGSWVEFVIGLILALVLFCALWVVGTSILDVILRDLLPDRAEKVYDFIGRINGCLVGAMSDWLFGLSKQNVSTLSNDEAIDEDWTGRVKYLENVLERMIADTKAELKSEILEMRAEIQEHFENE
ncbi:hypothetical protein ACA910_022727 [Epithemia clementina (nom. ined.)]